MTLNSIHTGAEVMPVKLYRLNLCIVKVIEVKLQPFFFTFYIK